MIKDIKTLIFFLKSDLYRYRSHRTKLNLLKDLLWDARCKYILWMRVTNYLSNVKWNKLFINIPFLIARIILQHYSYKCTIEIPYNTFIGPGLYLNHCCSIIVTKKSIIGKNCNISQNVTVGYVSRGKRKGAPIIGDNVYIGAGAIIIGQINIGDNAAIGAGAIVVKDVPDNAVVVGNPAKVISYEGSKGYINNVYDKTKNWRNNG